MINSIKAHLKRANGGGFEEAMESLEKNKKEMLKREFAVERENLPLVIIYKDKRYVLVLTKNERLVLHKAME